MTVYLIARPAVLTSALNEYLENNAFPYLRPVADAVTLIEVAGRVCYQSFPNPRPGGIDAYMANILASGHGCYDSPTDVLTTNGWKAWPDVLDTDDLYVMDPATESIGVCSRPTYIRTWHAGRMYRVDSQQVDLLVTPDHRLYVCPTTTLVGRSKQGYAMLTAANVGHTPHAYMKTGRWERQQYTVSENIAALLGFAIGDGYTTDGKNVAFHLRRERKITWLEATLRILGWEWNNKGETWRVFIPSRWEALFASIYDENREKRIPEGFLRTNSADVLRHLYRGLIASDGSETPTGDVYDTTSESLAGEFQQLCLFIGLAANLSQAACFKERRGSFGERPIYRLSVIRRSLYPEVNKWAGTQAKTSWEEDFDGPVYCADTGGNAIYVRRNGKPVWCGNSVLEHANFTFIITGVSRSLTHELVRHRAGWSYSQLSQRYVDESSAEMIAPADLDKDSLIAFRDATAISLAAYRALVADLTAKMTANNAAPASCPACQAGVIQDASTHHYICESCGWSRPYLPTTELRKAARGAARSVLPNATETQIVATANCRALRHFFELRGSKHADAEIRLLAVTMLALVRPHAPQIFADMTVIGGCIEAKYRKV